MTKSTQKRLFKLEHDLEVRGYNTVMKAGVYELTNEETTEYFATVVSCEDDSLEFVLEDDELAELDELAIDNGYCVNIGGVNYFLFSAIAISLDETEAFVLESLEKFCFQSGLHLAVVNGSVTPLIKADTCVQLLIELALSEHHGEAIEVLKSMLKRSTK